MIRGCRVVAASNALPTLDKESGILALALRCISVLRSTPPYESAQ